MRMNLNLTLEFSDDVTDEKAVMENVGRAILGELNSGIGIAPDTSEAYTVAFRISNELDSIDYSLENCQFVRRDN